MKALDLIPKLVLAGFESDIKTIEDIATIMIKYLKKDNLEIANEIKNILLSNISGTNNIRKANNIPVPIDRDTRLSLLKVETFDDIEDPVLDKFSMKQLQDFINERNIINKFIDEGISPTNSILLYGLPGVGKTYIAKWLSNKLKLPLVSLDLAASISSYLGHSGQNLKNIFDYARNTNVILFLDEFDSIAKRRDDISDIGELKRLVNILLKELEDFSLSSIIICSTNYPDLLDKAIWRRFDITINIPMPAEEQREKLINRHLNKYINEIDKDILSFLIANTSNINAANICKLCENIKRQKIIFENESLDMISLTELSKIIDQKDTDTKKKLCNILKKKFPKLSIRDIALYTNIPKTSITRYLKK